MVRRSTGATAAWLAAALGVVAAVALVGIMGGAHTWQRAALVEVAVSSDGKLLPTGGDSLWDNAIAHEPQRLKKLKQVCVCVCLRRVGDVGVETVVAAVCVATQTAAAFPLCRLTCVAPLLTG
jgi:hypothetical protein